MAITVNQGEVVRADITVSNTSNVSGSFELLGFTFVEGRVPAGSINFDPDSADGRWFNVDNIDPETNLPSPGEIGETFEVPGNSSVTVTLFTARSNFPRTFDVFFVLRNRETGEEQVMRIDDAVTVLASTASAEITNVNFSMA